MRGWALMCMQQEDKALRNFSGKAKNASWVLVLCQSHTHICYGTCYLALYVCAACLRLAIQSLFFLFVRRSVLFVCVCVCVCDFLVCVLWWFCCVYSVCTPGTHAYATNNVVHVSCIRKLFVSSERARISCTLKPRCCIDKLWASAACKLNVLCTLHQRMYATNDGHVCCTPKLWTYATRALWTYAVYLSSVCMLWTTCSHAVHVAMCMCSE